MSAPEPALTPPLNSPREIANKSDRRHLLQAIRMALDIQSPAIRRNTQTFNRSRYAAIAAIPDYDELKDRARSIKEKSVANLPQLLQQLEAVVTARGGHFFLAPTAPDACQYILSTCQQHTARLVVKGK